jgi:hypothetical protein
VITSLGLRTADLSLELRDVKADASNWLTRALKRLPHRELPRVANDSVVRIRFSASADHNFMTLLEIGPADSEYGYVTRCVAATPLQSLRSRVPRGTNDVLFPPESEAPLMILGTAGEYDLVAILSSSELLAAPPGEDADQQPMPSRVLRQLLATMRLRKREEEDVFEIRHLSFRLV